MDPGAVEHPVLGCRLLGNGRFAVMVNPAGAGFSWFGRHLLTKWEGDPTADRDGFFLWIRDAETGEVFPTGVTTEGEGEASWEPGCFEIRRSNPGFESRLEIAVDASEPFELRCLTIRNEMDRPREFEITSQIEIALSDPAGFAAHPSFSKLFIETEVEHEGRMLLARRRVRDRGEEHPWLVHAVDGTGAVNWETDRARFFRRGDFGIVPHVVASGGSLPGTVGNVLDPMFALRRRVVVKPGASEKLTFLFGAARNRQNARRLASACATPNGVERVMERAKDRTCAMLDDLRIPWEEAEELQQRIGSFLLGNLRRETERSSEHDEKARRFFAALGGPTDLFTPVAKHRQPAKTSPRHLGPGSATPALFSARGNLTSEPRTSTETLRFFNGFGGFTKSGDEYVLRISSRESGGLNLPPRPWTNVIANERFGFMVSETGAGMTWSENSREHRLTPWANDPLLDPHSEAIYVRDEETFTFWSPLPGPASPVGEYEVRHGFGKSTFLHEAGDFEECTEMFVSSRDPVKITSIRVRNRSSRRRHLSFFCFSRLVLGTDVRTTAPFLSTEHGPFLGSLLAKNENGGDFASRIAFAGYAVEGLVLAAFGSGDRESFLGRRGTLAAPRALSHDQTLDGTVGAGLDPCFAQQVVLEIEPGQEAWVHFFLGDSSSREESLELLLRYCLTPTIAAEREATQANWHSLLSAIRVETPSPALDLMMNGWLMHQVLACRMWGRSALYQSGGAYGFRDQLQDASSLALVHPEITRAQILLHTAHQFPEGDVLHWWHPPKSRGIRTRFADDLLWLPYLTAEYVRATGDDALLDEPAPFVAAPLLETHEDERYLLPTDSGTSAAVYEHCLRAIDRSLPRRGVHGLPLFGSGDWNDGMNRVGRAGRGESVWMGFFLAAVLEAFAPLCEKRGDAERAQRYRAERALLQATLNDAGWDGEWYRRGYYDGGEPLGSSASDECRIDALAQAWAVLSRTATPERARQAMGSVERYLVSEEDGLIRLLTPAFRATKLDPGYIKGYAPGVRENGGQYTHAALWVVAAFAELGRNDRVAPLLDLLNPIHHARTPEEVSRYQVEPYVIAADVYGEEPHVGRGGWTWYTGSAGWMMRVAMEYLLGIRMEGGTRLTIRPCVPDEWPGFTVRLRLSPEQTTLRIRATNPDRRARAVVRASLDARPARIEGGTAHIALDRDGGEHEIDLVLGDAAQDASPARGASVA